MPRRECLALLERRHVKRTRQRRPHRVVQEPRRFAHDRADLLRELRHVTAALAERDHKFMRPLHRVPRRHAELFQISTLHICSLVSKLHFWFRGGVCSFLSFS